VVVDETHVDFGCESSVGLVNRYPDLLVVHTLSKGRSLAGLGFAIGNPDLIEALDRVKNSFNSYPVDLLAMAGTAVAMEDRGTISRGRDGPSWHQFLRITIGTDEQCRVLVEALAEILG
jgi:histidinol-phosphate aminotransferase